MKRELADLEPMGPRSMSERPTESSGNSRGAEVFFTGPQTSHRFLAVTAPSIPEKAVRRMGVFVGAMRSTLSR